MGARLFRMRAVRNWIKDREDLWGRPIAISTSSPTAASREESMCGQLYEPNSAGIGPR
jgi:hypothetical protein